MLSIPGYQILSTIIKNSSESTFEALRESDSARVVLKIVILDHVNDLAITSIEHGFNIGRDRLFSGVLNVTQRSRFENSLVLELEHFEGMSLYKHLSEVRPSIEDGLRIAIGLINIIQELHRYNLLHRDIRPHHFMINKDNVVKLTDLAITADMNDVKEFPGLQGKFQYGLEYISPEQAGRMDLKEDYRSDFYSLGVTLYQVFSGRLPFEMTDPNELVHSHIAKQPTHIHLLDPAIPATISYIVHKLIEKKPEERYQTSKGIKKDLENCLAGLLESGTVPDFAPGGFDKPGQFKIAEKIYGREEEIRLIEEAYSRVSKKNEMILVYGNSGIGKSTLIDEVEKRLSRNAALFISGKFEQYVQNIPFEAVIKAFEGLICKISKSDPATLDSLRASIVYALGAFGQIVVEVIPSLETLIGKQPEIPELPPVEAQIRFVNVFSNFINVFTTSEHPLVIFLDDLQWADSSSLRFISRVMTALEGANLLVLGSYRKNEVDNDHPLAQTIREMERAGENFSQLNLLPLTLSQLTELISETLSCTREFSKPLADYIFTKTLGNPYYITETLKSLHRNHLITYNPVLFEWVWNLDEIKSFSKSQSSLELLSIKINKLSEGARQTLMRASCFGQEFELEMLAALSDKTPQETDEELKQAVVENLIVTIRNSNKADESLFWKKQYGFLHDQVQQAAYTMLADTEKSELHLTIGYFMLERLSKQDIEARIFEIVNHLNFSQELVSNSSDRLNLAELNQRAGRKAKTATAYDVSFAYFSTGLSLLNDDAWDSSYDFTMSLYIDAAECAYLTRDFNEADRLLAKILSKAKNLAERILAFQLQIQALIFRKKDDEGIALSLKVLDSLGVSFPSTPNDLFVISAYLRCKWAMRKMEIEDLESLPMMENPEILAAMKILQNITAIAFVRSPKLYSLMVLKMVQLSIRYGSAPESPLTYITFGAIVNAIQTDNDACYRYGTTALKLLDKFDNIGIRERTVLIFNIVNRVSKEHLVSAIEPLKRSYKVGIELGDIEYTKYASSSYSFFLLLSGKNLNWVKEEMLAYNRLPNSVREENYSNKNEALIQTVSNLLGESGHPTKLRGTFYDEGENAENILMLNEQSRIFTCFMYKMLLCYLTGEYSEALTNAKYALTYMDNVRGMLFQPLFHFYYALLNFEIARQNARKGKYWKVALYHRRQTAKWANQVPVNFQHRFYLLEAEYNRVLGNDILAGEYYDKSISESAENGYCQDEALANELAGAHWLQKGQLKLGSIYIISALAAYKKWGCVLKMDLLKQQYSDILDETPGTTEVAEHQNHKWSGGSITSSLDLATLMKASMAISSEVVFDRLMAKLMKFVIENAGAQSGYFLLDWGGELFIEVKQSIEQDKSISMKVPLKGSGLLPEEVICHVFETKTDVVLNDARLDSQFKNDAFVIDRQIRSVLCIPALNQGKLVGVLYLENNLTSGAFTHERVEMLRLLSGQIAVSIENAILYENLERKVAVRTTEIQIQKEEIERQKLLVEQKSQFKEQFFANMSHEIRTPMTAIIGMSELIFDTELNPKQMEYAKGIRYSSENLLAIINDILDYSKIEAGKFSFVNKPFHIRDRVNRLSYVLRVIAEDKGLDLAIIVDKEVSDQLIGDPIRLHQILLNLASNAIKFTEQGSVRIDVVKLSSTGKYEELAFRVSDTGIGIAEEKLQFIFETFSRIDEDGNGKHTGTGLGLFIAKKLVEEQGGTMTVTSQPGKGTEFQFNLNFEVCNTNAVEEDQEADVVLSDVKILLVEDNLFNQVVAEETLKKMIPNVTISIAGNGQVALEKLQEQQFDIVLMDVKMPVMDGYHATRAIRANETDGHIPILAFTSNANPQEALKCRDAGMDDYITKPIEAKKLKFKIKKLLDQFKKHSAEEHSF